MIKTLIIDDETIVIEGLKKLIKWTELGFELIGSAANGVEGVQKAGELKPDLIIADIRMPGLDGLSMIEKIKKENKDTIFVIMSGYSNFEYAKKALKLGVVDYLEKPATIQNVTTMLERVKEFYDKNLMEKDYTLGKTILEYVHSGQKASEFEEFMELKENQTYCVFRVKFKCYCKGDELNLEEKIKAYIQGLGLQLITIKKGKSFVGLIVGAEKERQKSKWRSQFQTAYVKMMSNNSGIYFGVGGIYNHIDEIRQSYREAKSAIGYAQFANINQVVLYDELMKSLPVGDVGDFDENLFIRKIKSGKKEEVIQYIRIYLDIFKKSRIDLRLFEQECLKLVYIGSRVVREKDKGFQIIFTHDMLIHEAFSMSTDYLQVEEWVWKAFDKILDAIESNREERGHQSFERALDFIEQNFIQDISLNDVADKAGMNPSYFSQIFKEKMGDSFVKYVTRLRLEYAKKLLNEGYKVIEVSERVGYINYRYFCDTFKKNVGMTPSQYRDS